MRAGRKRILAAFLAVSVLLAGIIVPGTESRAVFDESKAVAFRVHAASNTIEDSTLFIGTYLIHSQSMTDELYEKAMDSASESGQSNVYYKSELADGAWYDITDAQGLSQISGQGTPVEESELADLWVTHYVGSDGVVHEAKSGDAVNLFDDPDPYDLYNLPELEAIRLQYDNSFSADSTGVDKYYYEKLTAFFGLNLQNSVTAECDRQLDQLQSVYEDLGGEEDKEMAEIVSTLMGKVDARRRAEVFSMLSQIDDNELNKLQNVCSGADYNEGDYDDKQFVENANVSDAIGSAMERCEESYIEQAGKRLEEGTTVLKNVEYNKSMRVIELAAGGRSSNLEEQLTDLQKLYHIEDDIIADANGELELLENNLLKKVEDKYSKALSAGVNGKYRAAQQNGASEAMREQLLTDQKTDVETVRSEFQYLVEAKTKRIGTEEAIDYLYDEIDKVDGYRSGVKNDAFSVKAGESIDDAIIWLQSLIKSTAENDASYSTEMEDLEARKQELQNEKADALDSNDLSGAKRCDAEIALIDEKIQQKEDEINAILNSSNSSASERARAMSEAGNSTLTDNINRMKNDAMETLAEGGANIGASLANTMGALAALGAESALSDLKDKLEESGEDALAKDAQEAIEDSRNSSLHGATDGSGSGSGAGSGAGGGAGSGSGSGSGSAAAGEMDALLEGMFGSGFDGLSGVEKAAAAAAVSQLSADGNPDLADLALDYLNQCLGENNGYIFVRLNDTADKYIPLKTIAYAQQDRYVYDDTRKKATLSGAAGVSRFTVYKDVVTTTDGSKDNLNKRVESQNNLPYLSEVDAQDLFSCEAQYIAGSDYGVCLNKKMQDLVKQIIAAFQEEA